MQREGWICQSNIMKRQKSKNKSTNSLKNANSTMLSHNSSSAFEAKVPKRVAQSRASTGWAKSGKAS